MGHPPLLFTFRLFFFRKLTLGQNRGTFVPTAKARACLPSGGFVRATSYPVTDLLARWKDGDAAARDALIPLLYEELRRVARKCLAGQHSDHTLVPRAE